MSIPSIPPVGAGIPEIASSINTAAPGAQSPDFGRWMTEQLAHVNQKIETAEVSLGRLATGDGNLHQVMIDLEKARTAFQLTLQVRNKAVEGFQEILRMQI
jgi:flagellar hook-basal body complex protein FliE